MPYCFVPLCSSGAAAKSRYLEENNLPKPHFFTPGSEDRRAQWEKVIKRKDSVLTLTSRVCSEHFSKNDFETGYTTTCKDGNVHTLARGKAKLLPNAIPSFFPKYPVYYQPKQSKRQAPKLRDSPTTKKPKQLLVEVPPPAIIVTNHGGTDNDPPAEDDTAQVLVEKAITSPDKITTPKIWPCTEINNLKMPINWVVGNTIETDTKFVVHIEPKTQQITKCVTFKDQEAPIVKFRSVVCSSMDIPSKIESIQDAQDLLNRVDQSKMCAGTGAETKKFSIYCEGWITKSMKRCKLCNTERERLRKSEVRKSSMKKKQKEKTMKNKVKLQSLKRSKINLRRKIQQYKIKVENAMRESQQKKDDVLQEAISSLPSAQQEAVKACFQASKRKGPSGRRYTAEWVYECMLMRIKDTKLYNHIRNHQILVLPATSTINGYLKHYGGAYGFQPQVLEMLKKKTVDMPAKYRRGMILIDEMKLSEGIYFDASTLQVLGFKDMGEDAEAILGEDFNETVAEAFERLPKDLNAQKKQARREKITEKRKNDRDRNLGDHALVISFQPFCGKWVQAIACFLTRGNATDDELTKLILEAIILLEQSGLLVDGVVTDGANWNRSMWTKFGIDKENCSAEHPCDPERRFFFISDFPHLMKCMRNCLTSKKIILTPNGDVKLQHWDAILEAESLHKLGLKECHRLTKDHVHPDPWQKMDVSMAWQFWSASVAAAMDSYRLQGVEMLDDCSASIEMCKLINKLADAMNSHTPATALRLNSPQYQAIEEFLEYFINLKEWANAKLKEKLLLAEKVRIENLRREGKNPRGKSFNQEDFIFSDSTDIGLIVSLKGALQLVKFLIEKCGYGYVMTSRLNQDALERFFGLVRQSCGRNTHPEPRMFAQLFRLLSIYSLVKPCRGSNITGGGMITTLLSLDDLKSKTREERQQALIKKLDEIIVDGKDLDPITQVAQLVAHDHDYIGDGESIDEFALSYVTGFVARHSKKYTQDCDECEKWLVKPQQDRTDVDLLITNKSIGFLTYPSDAIVDLTKTLERIILKTAANNEMEENILFLVLNELEKVKINQIGCDGHKHALTKSIIKFYMIMRMHFITKRWNEQTKEVKKKQKAHRKQAHLT